jgi:hypothetical protein
LGIREQGLVAAECGLRLIDLSLEYAGIDLRQPLALLDLLTLDEVDVGKGALYLGVHRCHVQGLNCAQSLKHDRNILLQDFGRSHGNG